MSSSLSPSCLSSSSCASSESQAFAAFLPQKNKRERDISDPGILGRCSVILVRTEGSINLGQIARSCANMGITDLRLVDPRCEIDCSDSRKFAHHARPLMHGAPVFTCMKDCVSDLQIVIGTSARAHAGIELDGPEQIPAYLQFRTTRAGSGSGSGTATGTCIHNTKFGLVFGNEKDGLTSEELSWCQAYMHIPTYGTYTSLNLATAVSITLYTIQRVWRHGEVGIAVVPTGSSDTPVSSTATVTSSSTACIYSPLASASASASQSQSQPQPQPQSQSQSQSSSLEFSELASFALAFQCDGSTANPDSAEGVYEGQTEDEKQHHQQLRVQRKLGVLDDNSPAPRSHVDFLNRYWMGTNERFGYFINEEWRTRYQVIMTQMLNHLQLSYKSINLIHGMLSQYNQYMFGDRALSMARTGRAPAPPSQAAATNSSASTSAPT